MNIFLFELIFNAVFQQDENIRENEKLAKALFKESEDPSKEELVLYDYQQECLNSFISQENNLIVNIRTTGGKTLIAVKLMDYYCLEKKKPGLFLVPTRTLVLQQAK